MTAATDAAEPARSGWNMNMPAAPSAAPDARVIRVGTRSTIISAVTAGMTRVHGVMSKVDSSPAMTLSAWPGATSPGIIMPRRPKISRATVMAGTEVIMR